MLKKLAFETSHVASYLVFDVLNAKIFAFSTLDASALMGTLHVSPIFIRVLLKSTHIVLV